MTLQKEVQEKITGILTTLFPHAKIYLFGSRARGTNTEYSDIDIAIDAGQKMTFSAIGEAGDVMEALHIPYKVDVVDLYRLPDTLRQEVLNEGIQWK